MRITAGDITDIIDRLMNQHGGGITTEDEKAIRILRAVPRSTVIGGQWRFEHEVSSDETIVREFDSRMSALEWISVEYGGQDTPSVYIGLCVLDDRKIEMSLNELL